MITRIVKCQIDNKSIYFVDVAINGVWKNATSFKSQEEAKSFSRKVAK